jgi:hypothetical protein
MVIHGAASGGDRRPRRLRRWTVRRAMRRVLCVHELALIRRSLFLARDRYRPRMPDDDKLAPANRRAGSALVQTSNLSEWRTAASLS